MIQKLKFETGKKSNRACQRCLEKLKAYEVIGIDTLKKASALSIYIRLDYGNEKFSFFFNSFHFNFFLFCTLCTYFIFSTFYHFFFELQTVLIFVLNAFNLFELFFELFFLLFF